MRRVVFNYKLSPGLEVELDQAQLHYLFDVLRMQMGSKLIGLDQEGNAFVVQMGSRAASSCTVLEPAGERGREPGLAISLFVPLLKGDKLELVVQKSVELGVSSIILFNAQRSVVKLSGNFDKKIARLQKIATDATQQCGRHKVPSIKGLLSLKEVSGHGPGIFAWEQEKNYSLARYLHSNPPSENLAILTGPEGGLTPDEAKILTEAGWASVLLGNRILRAETAAISIVACTMFAWGEMG